MAIERMDHVGVVVEDLAAAIEFFVALGLELEGEMSMADDRAVDSITGLEGVRTDFAFVRTPDGQGALELIKFHSPRVENDAPEPQVNTPGLRHLTFRVD